MECLIAGSVLLAVGVIVIVAQLFGLGGDFGVLYSNLTPIILKGSAGFVVLIAGALILVFSRQLCA